MTLTLSLARLAEHLTVGAAADSGHEYLLKLYLLTAQSDEASLDLCSSFLLISTAIGCLKLIADVSTANRILTSLLYVSPKRGLLYVTDTQYSAQEPLPSHHFEHLSCFLPGLLALGAHTLPESTFQRSMPLGERPTLLDEAELRRYDWRELHMLAAEGLAESCYQMYADQPTGLGPDEVVFDEGGELWIRRMRQWRMSGKLGLAPGIGARKLDTVEKNDYKYKDLRYLLRPEVRLNFSPLLIAQG